MKNIAAVGKLMSSRGYIAKTLSDNLPGRFGIHFTGLIEDFSGFTVTHLKPEEMTWRASMIKYMESRSKPGEEDPRVKLWNVVAEMAGIILLKMVSERFEDYRVDETLKRLSFDAEHPGLGYKLAERDKVRAESFLGDPTVVSALQDPAFKKKFEKLISKLTL